MGLRIQNNLAAMNAHKNLTRADESMSKSLERLSSGFRINKASDDAAGLAISEGFRADIASFRVASRNTTEANALLQVAEGGMEQIGNMLTRLKELATQAASANVGSSERTKLNAEGNALVSEIDRIANSTKYGSTALLDGTFGASKAAASFTYSAVAGSNLLQVYGNLTHVYSGSFTATSPMLTNFSGITSLNSTMAYSGTWAITATDAGTTVWLSNGTITEAATITAMSTVSAATQTLSFANLGITMRIWAASTVGTACGIGLASSIEIRETGLSTLNVAAASSGVYTFSPAGAGVLTLGNGTVTQTISNVSPGTATSINFSTLGITFDLGTKYTEDDLENVNFTVTSSGSGNVFQIGARNDSNNQISLNISGVTTGTLNSGLIVDKLDTQTEAQSMLTTVDSAISALTAARATIGASMNRLSYAAANLQSSIENVQAAESVIRDVDMASEMTAFTKNQILMQASIAMLAQANQSPQLMLSLFK
ncbi:MAG TPA: flagellin [Syntrophales bacterium]|nr:flagellin [Syntrophales bacterium]